VTLLSGWTWAREQKPDVVFVPTPPEVVAKMLEMAAVGKQDVVYDLGCGDGRIVITAVQKFGAKKGIGIDIDPQRIKESTENAKKAGVTDRVKFLQQDLFKTDISEASVVTLYLLPSLNVRLRPYLFHMLRPGDRIVSHSFDMAEWKPDQTADVDTEGFSRMAYYWVLPAGVAGSWRWDKLAADGGKAVQLRLHQRFQAVSGSCTVGGQEVPIRDAKLKGSELSFTVTRPVDGKPLTLRYTGRASGDTITGTVQPQGDSSAEKQQWMARRDKAELTGTWNWKHDGESVSLRVERRDGQLAATYQRGNQPLPVAQFYAWGGGFYCVIENGSKQTYEGIIDAGQLLGTRNSEGTNPQPWSAARAKQ
jgi:SAM-dependent methyltransferase